jgi:hypothetical protein
MASEIAEHRGLPAERYRTRLYERLVAEDYRRVTGEDSVEVATVYASKHPADLISFDVDVTDAGVATLLSSGDTFRYWVPISSMTDFEEIAKASGCSIEWDRRHWQGEDEHPPEPRDMFTSDYSYDEIVAAATETYWVIPINTDDQNFGRWWRVADRSESGLVHYEPDHR